MIDKKEKKDIQFSGEKNEARNQNDLMWTNAQSIDEFKHNLKCQNDADFAPFLYTHKQTNEITTLQ